jgi:hypothetical protein
VATVVFVEVCALALPRRLVDTLRVHRGLLQVFHVDVPLLKVAVHTAEVVMRGRGDVERGVG